MELIDTVIGTVVGVIGTATVSLYMKKADFKKNSEQKTIDDFEKLVASYEELMAYLESNVPLPQLNTQKLRRVLSYLEQTKKVCERLTVHIGSYGAEMELNRLYDMNHDIVSSLSLKERQYLFDNHRYLKEFIDEISQGVYQGQLIFYSYKYWDSYVFDIEERKRLLAGEQIQFSCFNKKLKRKEIITGVLKKGKENIWYVYRV